MNLTERQVLRAGKLVARKLSKSLKSKKGGGGSRSEKALASIRLKVNGQISQDELNRRLQILGELVINEVKKNIVKYRLISNVGGGAYLQGWFASVENGELTIENTQDYAVYIEYGTYAFGRSYGESNWPENPPKKKDLPDELARAFPRGMAPFAPVRRVWYNQEIMQRLVNIAFA